MNTRPPSSSRISSVTVLKTINILQDQCLVDHQNHRQSIIMSQIGQSTPWNAVHDQCDQFSSRPSTQSSKSSVYLQPLKGILPLLPQPSITIQRTSPVPHTLVSRSCAPLGHPSSLSPFAIFERVPTNCPLNNPVGLVWTISGPFLRVLFSSLPRGKNPVGLDRLYLRSKQRSKEKVRDGMEKVRAVKGVFRAESLGWVIKPPTFKPFAKYIFISCHIICVFLDWTHSIGISSRLKRWINNDFILRTFVLFPIDPLGHRWIQMSCKSCDNHLSFMYR
jgi:hypothetical protein